MARRSDYRPVPEPRLPARLASGFAYVLLVVTCTVVAALGGYQVGTRSSPSEGASVSQREAALRQAVKRGVARQKAADRVLRVEALKDLAAFQRDKFESELSARVSEVRLAEAANAARAYRRGKAAGRVTAVKAAETADAADAADAAEAAEAAEAEATAAADETTSADDAGQADSPG